VSENPEKIKCVFGGCDFEGSKNDLLNHYGMKHFIRLENLIIQPQVKQYLEQAKSQALVNMLTAPLESFTSPPNVQSNAQLQRTSFVVPRQGSAGTSSVTATETLIAGSLDDQANVIAGGSVNQPQSVNQLQQ